MNFVRLRFELTDDAPIRNIMDIQILIYALKVHHPRHIIFISDTVSHAIIKFWAYNFRILPSWKFLPDKKIIIFTSWRESSIFIIPTFLSIHSNFRSISIWNIFINNNVHVHAWMTIGNMRRVYNRYSVSIFNDNVTSYGIIYIQIYPCRMNKHDL